MVEELHTIEASLRTETGKSACRKLRKAGLIPANLIGAGKATALQLDPHLLPKVYKGGKKFNLNFDGTTKAAVVKELHLEPIKRRPLHIDIMYVD